MWSFIFDKYVKSCIKLTTHIPSVYQAVLTAVVIEPWLLILPCMHSEFQSYLVIVSGAWSILYASYSIPSYEKCFNHNVKEYHDLHWRSGTRQTFPIEPLTSTQKTNTPLEGFGPFSSCGSDTTKSTLVSFGISFPSTSILLKPQNSLETEIFLIVRSLRICDHYGHYNCVL